MDSTIPCVIWSVFVQNQTQFPPRICILLLFFRNKNSSTSCVLMKTITKADLLRRVSEATGVTKVETEVIIDGFMKSIIETLQDGNRIEMRGFGVFMPRKRRPRMARNPRTGENVPMDEHFVPVFKPSREMREHVNTARLKAKAEMPAPLVASHGQES